MGSECRNAWRTGVKTKNARRVRLLGGREPLWRTKFANFKLAPRNRRSRQLVSVCMFRVSIMGSCVYAISVWFGLVFWRTEHLRTFSPSVNAFVLTDGTFVFLKRQLRVWLTNHRTFDRLRFNVCSPWASIVTAIRAYQARQRRKLLANVVALVV